MLQTLPCWFHRIGRFYVAYIRSHSLSDLPFFMFNFFKKKPPPEAVKVVITEEVIPTTATVVVTAPDPAPSEPAPKVVPRQAWLDKLKAGLRKTGSSIAAVFTGTQIDDALYEDLETALLMADTGTAATQFLLDDASKTPKQPIHKPSKRC